MTSQKDLQGKLNSYPNFFKTKVTNRKNLQQIIDARDSLITGLVGERFFKIEVFNSLAYLQWLDGKRKTALELIEGVLQSEGNEHNIVALTSKGCMNLKLGDLVSAERVCKHLEKLENKGFFGVSFESKLEEAQLEIAYFYSNFTEYLDDARLILEAVLRPHETSTRWQWNFHLGQVLCQCLTLPYCSQRDPTDADNAFKLAYNILYRTAEKCQDAILAGRCWVSLGKAIDGYHRLPTIYKSKMWFVNELRYPVLGHKRPEDAILACYIKAEECAPKDHVVLLESCNFYFHHPKLKSVQTEKIIRFLERNYRLNKTAETCLFLSKALFYKWERSEHQSNELLKAFEYSEEAEKLAFKPDFKILNVMGEIQFYLEKYPAAVANLVKAVELRSTGCETNSERALTFKLLAKSYKAIQNEADDKATRTKYSELTIHAAHTAIQLQAQEAIVALQESGDNKSRPTLKKILAEGLKDSPHNSMRELADMFGLLRDDDDIVIIISEAAKLNGGKMLEYLGLLREAGKHEDVVTLMSLLLCTRDFLIVDQGILFETLVSAGRSCHAKSVYQFLGREKYQLAYKLSVGSTDFLFDICILSQDYENLEKLEELKAMLKTLFAFNCVNANVAPPGDVLNNWQKWVWNSRCVLVVTERSSLEHILLDCVASAHPNQTWIWLRADEASDISDELALPNAKTFFGDLKTICSSKLITNYSDAHSCLLTELFRAIVK